VPASDPAAAAWAVLGAGPQAVESAERSAGTRVRQRPGTAPQISNFAPPLPTSPLTRLPAGGGAASGGSGGLGSAAPPAIALVALLALAASSFLSKRFFFDPAPWRLLVLAPRLERPG